MSSESYRLVADYVLPCDVDDTVIPGGAVDIDEDGRILAVGAEAELGPGPMARRIGGLLLPGLVNAHAHTPMTLVRSAGDGLPLARWLTEGVWPLEGRMTGDDARVGMALGAAEMLLNGVTTTCEMYLHEEAVVAGATDVGIRLVVTAGVVPDLAPGGDPGDRIDEIDRFHQRHHDPANGVSVGYAPHAIYSLSPEICGEIAVRARARGALVHIHLEETESERHQVIERWGATATHLLADAGVFDGAALVAHGVWLDEADRRILSETGTAVVHCPQSNLKLGSGIAPVVELLDQGVTVVLGTDGPASNDALDLWEEVKLAPLLARGRAQDPTVLGPGRALRMATGDGAAAVGLADVGVLRPGAMADLVRVDLDGPHLRPVLDDRLLGQVVFGGGSRAVTDVWVGGRQVVADRLLTTVEPGSLVADAQVRAERLVG